MTATRLDPTSLLPAGWSTPLVSDALDALGFRRQALGWDISPLSGGSMCGPAFPVRLERVSTTPEIPYVGLLAALDAAPAGAVFVFPTDRAEDVAVWGELLSTICIERGSAGALTDGMIRDSGKIRDLGFPVWGRGTLPSDINGRFEVVAHDVPASIDGVSIDPGQLIAADGDGVVVVPSEATEDVVRLVAEKKQNEAKFQRSILEGMSATDAYAKWKVL